MKKILQSVFNTIVLFGIFTKLILLCKSKKKDFYSMPKVLLLASDFLPNINGGIYRPLSWLQHSDINLDINVVTSESKTSEIAKAMEANIPPNVKRFFVKDAECFYRIARKLSSRPSYLISCYKFCLNLFKASKPDIIIATAPDFSSFIAATVLSKIFGSKLILDYRDEWVDNPFDFVAPTKFDLYFESKCLQAATLVIFTTESQKSQLIIKYPISGLANKVVVIPNGYEDVSYVKKDICTTDNPQCVISFAGALAEHTNPYNFLNFLEEFLAANKTFREQLLVQFIGSKSEAVSETLQKFRYKDSIKTINQISPNDLKIVLSKSDFLLLLVDDRFKRYIPGKVYEYIAMKKPILVFGVNECREQYEIYSLLNNFGNAYFISNFEDFNNALSVTQNYLLTPDAEKEFINGYSRKNLAQKFWDIILS